ncbi:MAG: ferredoxin-type protein NapF [Hydrogenothermaceae bacterium]
MDRYTRRGLFKALPSLLRTEDNKKIPNLIRPPYLKEDTDFKQCYSCNGYCVAACEENILFRDENNIPYIEFKHSGCTFCGKCMEACQYGVLSNPDKKRIEAVTTINTDKCLAWNKTMCFSCRDYCIDDAIKFKGLFNPEIISSKCTNCGFCVISCPVKAIEIRGLS